MSARINNPAATVALEGRFLSGRQQHIFMVGMCLVPLPILIHGLENVEDVYLLTALLASIVVLVSSIQWFHYRTSVRYRTLTEVAGPIVDWRVGALVSSSGPEAVPLIERAFGGADRKPNVRLYKAVIVAARCEYGVTKMARSKKDFLYAVAQNPDVLSALAASAKAGDSMDLVRKIVDGSYPPLQRLLARAEQRVGDHVI